MRKKIFNFTALNLCLSLKSRATEIPGYPVRWRELELIDGDQISICLAHVIIEKVSHPSTRLEHRQ